METEVESRSRAAALLSLLVGVSIAARLLLLLRRPLWFDELFTAWAARLSPGALLAALRLDSGPPGFYILEKPFAALSERIPGGEGWLRAPSFVASLVLLAFAAATPRGRSRSAFLALAAASPLVTFYASEARPYALLGVFVFGAFRLALFGPPTPGRLAGAALCAAAALYLHYLAILAVAALFVLALSAGRGRAAVALAAGGAAFAPWFPVLRGQPSAATIWMQESLAGSLGGFLSAFGGVGRIPAPFGGPAPRLLVLVAMLAGAVLLVAVCARARRDPDLSLALAFLLAVLGGALLAARVRPIAFAGRTEMAVLPVWLWAAARACGESRTARWGAAGSVLCGVAATAWLFAAGRPASGGSDVAQAMANVAREGDRVVAAAGLYLPLRLEGDRGRLTASLSALPEPLSSHPGWFVPVPPGPDEVRAVARAAEDLHPGQRLYLVVPPSYASAELLSALRAPGGRVRELSKGPEAWIILRTQEAPSPATAAP